MISVVNREDDPQGFAMGHGVELVRHGGMFRHGACLIGSIESILIQVSQSS